MTDKELIKQEIEYRLSSGKYSINSKQALEDIIVFIDSLPEERNEDLEEASIAYSCANPSERSDGMYDQTDIEWAFEAGAEWQKNKMKEALQTEYEKGRYDMREEMMKTLVEGEIVKDIHNQLSVKSEQINDTFGKFGDKVKIIIIKQD